MDIDQLFKGMQNAQVFGRGNYMGEGVFLVETTRLFVKSGFKGNAFICEFKIVESSNPKHAPGTTGSWVVKLDKPNAFGDVKSLIFALTGKDPKKVPSVDDDPKAHAEATEIAKAACDESYAKKIGAEPGFLEGIPVRLETTVVKTKTGGDFTRHNWSPAG